MFPIDELPVDGYGGTLYDYDFEVPVYANDPGVYDTLNWEQIDLFYESNASSTVLSTMAFTICLVSLLYTIALTPATKRRRPIHTLLVLALAIKVVDRAVAISLLLHSPNVSSYISLTLDVRQLRLTNSYRARAAILQCASTVAFLFLQACLYLHGKPLLTLVKLNVKAVYYAILTFLVTAGVIAFAVRVTLAVNVLSNLSQPSKTNGGVFQAIHQASLITFSVSIGSWSLVFFCSATAILLKRRQQLVSRNRMYESILNLIVFIGLESFLLPLALAILQLAPQITPLLSNSTEVLLVPSILLVLPLASLFSSSHSTNTNTNTSNHFHHNNNNNNNNNHNTAHLDLNINPAAAAATAASDMPDSRNTTAPPSTPSKPTRHLFNFGKQKTKNSSKQAGIPSTTYYNLSSLSQPSRDENDNIDSNIDGGIEETTTTTTRNWNRGPGADKSSRNDKSVGNLQSFELGLNRV